MSLRPALEDQHRWNNHRTPIQESLKPTPRGNHIRVTWVVFKSMLCYVFTLLSDPLSNAMLRRRSNTLIYSVVDEFGPKSCKTNLRVLLDFGTMRGSQPGIRSHRPSRKMAWEFGLWILCLREVNLWEVTVMSRSRSSLASPARHHRTCCHRLIICCKNEWCWTHVQNMLENMCNRKTKVMLRFDRGQRYTLKHV